MLPASKETFHLLKELNHTLKNSKENVTPEIQKEHSRGVLKKRPSENMQQFYWRTPMSKSDFDKAALQHIEITLQHGVCFPVSLRQIFRPPFYKNTSGVLLRN